MTADDLKQIESKLKYNPKVIVVDEIDFLFTNTHTIETLRDIHDKLGIPIFVIFSCSKTSGAILGCKTVIE